MRYALIGFMLALGFSSTASAEPTAEQLRDTIRQYVSTQEKNNGAFVIPDPKEGKGLLRTLSLVRVHERVGKTGDYYYSCTDMKDAKTGDELDLDYDVQDTAGKLEVVAVRIHKDNGRPRYTYGDNDKLIFLANEKSAD